MSAVLLVIKDKKQIAKVAVTSSTFIIGRAPQCDLPIDEPLASRQHVEILRDGEQFFVRDRESRNGTLLNGQRLTERRELNDGDEIAIGAMRLKFVWERGGGGEEADEDATRAASPVDLKKLAPSQKVVQKKQTDLEVKLRVLEGPLKGEVFHNWESPLTIGRSPDNNVPLMADDSSVSGRHARIVSEGDRYFIEDLGSTNGTFLNTSKVRQGEREPLSNGDKIRVGAAKDGAVLVFEMVDLRKRRKTTRIALISAGAIVVIAVLVKVLQPADVAGQNVEKARQFAAAGNLAKAREAYETALRIDPARAEAKRGLAQVKAALDAREWLGQAEASAVAENYDKAKELVYRVLRDFPKDSRALELETVIKSIENARIAFAARNWSDAVRLLEKAREAYPKSELISVRLAQAQKESVAQQSLAKAKDALQHQQYEMAQGLLVGIVTNSVYYTEAREYLDKIDQERRTADGLAKIQASYREGKLTEALTTLADIEKGSGATANPVLVELRDRVRKMATLTDPLTAAEGMKLEDGVETLLQGRKACDEVLALEQDPLNTIRRRAVEASNHLTQWLQTSAQTYTIQAQDLLKSGNRKEAMRLLLLAVKADSSNTAASQAMNDLRKIIVLECKSLYQKGIVHEELGQADLAREMFKKVLEIGSPGEEYFEKATRKLK